MKNDDETFNEELEKLKQQILDVSEEKQIRTKQPYSFHKRLEQKLKKNSQNEYESSKQIDVLQAGEYLKLLCHQKKYLSQKRADKIKNLNQSLHIDQQDFKYMFMVTSQANYYKLEYPGYYQRLLQQVDKYPQNMFHSIQKDIPRTLMNEHPFQKSLRNVLIAYAIKNPSLLYCQGMNYLVAYFLINNISEEETFWIISCLIQNILPDDFFKDLTTISITAQIFSDVLPYLFPQLAKQMKQIGMDCSLFIVSWYVCLFTKGFINSVSAYLMSRLILQSRIHTVGFILLRLSLGVIATILGRDQPFAFRRQFVAFRDKLQQSVFQISLLQIKLGIEYVELNETNYLKLEKYYRDKRQERHINTLEKDLVNKKFTLPKCSLDFPVCLHRVEIQRRIGQVQEVLITKNGYDIMSQYIEDYFDSEPKKQSNCNVYETINDCLMYRQKHICQEDLCEISSLNLEQKLTNHIQLKNDQNFHNFSEQQISGLAQGQSSTQVQRRYSKVDSKFIELSGYFVIDEKFNFGGEQVVQEQQFDWDENLDRQNIDSKTSLEEPFNLAEQLQKNNIEQDWIKNQDQYTNANETSILQNNSSKNNKQPFQSTEKTVIQNKLNDQAPKTQQISLQSINIEIKRKSQAKLGQQKSRSPKKESQNLIQSKSTINAKQKIWNYFGKTWRKVLKIKVQQLQN